MTVLRGALPGDGFTIIPNSWLRDPRISAKAKGLLAYIASHAEGYVLTIEQMRREMHDAETSIRSGLEALEQAGYLKRERQRDEGGRLGHYTWKLEVSPAQDQTTKPSLDNPGWKTSPPKKTSSKKTTEEDQEDPSAADASAPNAGDILREFIDWMRGQVTPINLTSQQIARLGKEVKVALSSTGIEVATVKWTLVEMFRRGKLAYPSTFGAVLLDVQAGKVRPISAPPAYAEEPGGGGQFKTAATQHAEQHRRELEIATMADVLMAERDLGLDEAYQVAKDLHAKGARPQATVSSVDKGVDGCTGVPYIEGEITAPQAIEGGD